MQTPEKFGKCASTVSTDESVLLSNKRKGPVFEYSLFFQLHFNALDSSVIKVHFDCYHGAKKLHVPFLPDGRLTDFT